MNYEILAVKKDGPDYHWFNLLTHCGESLTVYDVKWEIKETEYYPMLTVLDTDDSGQIINCVISGSISHIESLLSSLGWGTVDKPAKMNMTPKEELLSMTMALDRVEEMLTIARSYVEPSNN